MPKIWPRHHGQEAEPWIERTVPRSQCELELLKCKPPGLPVESGVRLADLTPTGGGGPKVIPPAK
jgi:hypothetical protein